MVAIVKVKVVAMIAFVKNPHCDGFGLRLPRLEVSEAHFVCFCASNLTGFTKDTSCEVSFNAVLPENNVHFAAFELTNISTGEEGTEETSPKAQVSLTSELKLKVTLSVLYLLEDK